MGDLFYYILKEFFEENKLNRMFQFEIIENFCFRNNLNGIDGINGLLGYVKRLISEGSFLFNFSKAHIENEISPNDLISGFSLQF